MNKSILLLIAFFTCFFSFSQTIKYVTPTGAGLKNGSSWTNALSGTDFRDHIFSATAGTQYWLASGLYRPNPVNLSNGISVYGGFSGNETALNQRNATLNVTTIWPTSNGFYIRNPTKPVVLDGVTIDSGYSSTNTTIGGYGAGVYIEDGWDNVTINNVKFVNNVSPSSGGAICIKGTNAASPSITNCSFENNSATGVPMYGEGGGGAIYINAISVGSRLEIHPIIKNCNFNSNKASGKGGAITIEAEDNVPCFVKVEKCNFIANTSTSGGGAISVLSWGGAITCSTTKNYYNGNNGGICGGAIEILSLKTNTVVQAVVQRSVFLNNRAGFGGAISNGYNTSSVENSKLGKHSFGIENCDFVNNSADKGTTIYNQGAIFTGSPIINSIFYNNNKVDEIVNLDYNDNVLSPLNVSHSVFYPNAYPGTANINSDPLFYNRLRELGNDGIIGTTDDGLQLSCASPAINKGLTYAGVGGYGGDITGNTLLSGGVVDIGAYEQSGTAVIPSVSIEATSTSVCLGTDITFTASVTNFSSNPYYYWKKNGVAVGSGGNTYTDKTLLNNDVITCVVTTNKNSDFICQTTDTATSNSITIIGTTPEVPTAVSPQIFCFGATINDLKATGTDIKWYRSATEGDPLTPSTVLSGGVYYVNQTINGCESTRVAVTVTTKSTSWPTAYSQTVCNPATVSNLVATGTDIKWYDSIKGGVPLSPSATLSTKTYYVTQTLSSCESVTRKAVAITVNTPNNPTFTPVSPVCAGATLAALPTYSTNSIYGIWNPAIDNTKTTDYTFTPEAGQCANSATMTIEVIPNETPTFTQVSPICAGTTLAALPTTSNNGIKGSWGQTLDNTKTTNYTFTPDAGQCANSTTMTIEVIPNETPTFTQVSPICAGATLAALPTSSTNSISGTWNPAIDNTKTTDYTFTPTTGQCANTATMTITVNPKVTPTFTPVATICSGATLVALPTSSTNSISGTWNPAIDNTKTTDYTFTPDIGQCASIASMTILVNTVSKPIGESTQTFVQGQTLSNINISGMGIKWYDSDFDATNQTNPLVTTTPLLNGKTYYATQTINGCSSKALAILVTVTLDKNIFELNDGIKVIPNPFNNSFNISIDSSDGQTVFIHIYDLVGKLIEARELSASGLKHASFGDNFATGFYNVVVTQGDRYKTLRVIKK